MKNYLMVLLAMLCLPVITTAQRWNLEKKHSIDIVAGVEVSFFQLSPTQSNHDQFAKIRQRTKEEILHSSHRFGIDYNFALTEKLFLKTGGRMLTSGYNSTAIETFNNSEKEQIVNFKQKGIEQSFNYKYKFVEIPLAARWVYTHNRCKSFIEGGLAGMVYLQSRVTKNDGTAEFSKPYVRLNEEVTPFHLYATLSIGGEFWITEDFPAYVKLNGRAQISDFINDGISERTQGLGIVSGVRYLF